MQPIFCTILFLLAFFVILVIITYLWSRPLFVTRLILVALFLFLFFTFPICEFRSVL